MIDFSVLGNPRRSLFARVTIMMLLVACVISALTPTVFAQTTYVITDGDQVKVYTTFTSSPATVLDRAGVELDEEDTYTTQPGDGVSEITVQRQQLITVNNCGVPTEVTSYGESLQNLLDRLGIPSHGNYVVSLPLDTETFDGMEVTVDCILQREQTYTEDMPYETAICYDPNLPEGQQEVLVEGSNGQIMIKANVVYCNGQETNRTVLEETVIQQPVKKIVAVGTGDGTATQAPAIGDGVIVTAEGELLTYSRSAQFRATAYTHTDEGCNMTTATGTTVRVGTVAVDPTVIPYGTRMFIVANDGSYIYGIGTAEDCGGAIKGDRLDLYFPTDPECWAFGWRNCTVYFLD